MGIDIEAADMEYEYEYDMETTGARVGLAVGFLVGFEVGLAVGVFVGFEVGLAVGVFVGSGVGSGVGVRVGFFVLCGKSAVSCAWAAARKSSARIAPRMMELMEDMMELDDVCIYTVSMAKMEWSGLCR